ncbi:glycoside hydrolase family 16 protein, partial [Aquitalea sp. ASV11]|uniref:glycoside hydrolase family 16 protein n=1 Tax=Aquitalea sp. ASV11 TaxID=2795103 RepID=UPI0018ECFE33
ETGYDEVNKKWLGYDWVVKRTLPESREQQIYVDPMYMGKSNKPLGINPFSLRNGDLFITACSIPPNLNAALPGFAFTSGLLTTRTSFLQMYGYFEIEAIVPQAPYLVPAFWLLPFDKSWPPEVDVFEAPGHEPGTIITTIHAKDAAGKFLHTGCRLAFQDFDKAFHKYGVLWLPDRLIFYIDRKPVSIVSSPVTFNKPMYMLANLAVGGNWVGFKNSTDGMPVSMVVRDMAAYTLDKAKTCSIVQGGVRECQGI